MSVLSNLKPSCVMQYFEEISAIPRGSGNTKAIGDYCVNFAAQRRLECVRDDAGNVVIIKQASLGYEKASAVIIQGHLDMVCEKEPGCELDMSSEGLCLATDGTWIWAEGTTLGADNGIAVAMALALLDSEDLPHPRLEVVLTADEEIGLIGAAKLNTHMLQGRYMLNLDSETEGVLTISCAGGVRADCHIPMERELFAGCRCHLRVEGVAGGHSGIKIIEQGANANVLMGRLLFGVSQEMPLRIVHLSGGMSDNAIATFCEAEILVPREEVSRLCGVVASYADVFCHEFECTDPGLSVTCATEHMAEEPALTLASTTTAVSALMILPNGLQMMSHHIPGLVQTSLNMGMLRLCDDQMTVGFSVRSSLATEKAWLCNRIDCAVSVLGGSVSYSGEYPGWEYRPESPLRDLVVDVYEKKTGKRAVVEAIHAGLECGIFASKIPGLDCVSIGPDMTGLHSPAERLNVASTERTWELICEVLRRTKEL